MSSGWIYDDNLRLFMDALAHFAGTSFDDDDWVGLEHDLILRPDQLDRERHTEWPLGEAKLDLFCEPGGSTVHYTVHADERLSAQADALGFVLQHALWKPG